jgi:hypothetical protein
MVDDFAKVVAAMNLIFNLAKNLADFVFQRIGTARLLLKAIQVREKLLIDKVAQVITSLSCVMVWLAFGIFGCCPRVPTVSGF